MKTVLITRPDDFADETAHTLKEMGCEAMCAPMLSAQAQDCPAELPEKQTGYIITSRRTFSFLTPYKDQIDLTKPVYCVGEKTASAARDFGFLSIVAGMGGSAELAEVIQNNEKRKAAFIHFGGQHVNADMYEVLQNVHIDVHHIPVYTMKNCDEIDKAVLKALKDDMIDVVMFFSARTVKNFNRLVTAYGVEKNVKRITALCISDRVAECVDQIKWGDIKTADDPSHVAMIKALSKL